MLKYHTFNNRVMVYDDRGHFIGDAHWQSDGDLEPGDEFQLDRGAAIVQVSDCTGQREQDLTELLDKRAKEVEKRRANAGARASGPRTTGVTAGAVATTRNDQTPSFLRHRSLNDIVGTPARIGRAVISPHSPYEARLIAKRTEQQDIPSPSEDSRPSKRAKRDLSPPNKSPHARSLFGATLTLTPFASSAPPNRSQALQDGTPLVSNTTSNVTEAIQSRPGKGNRRRSSSLLQEFEIIDLSSTENPPSPCRSPQAALPPEARDSPAHSILASNPRPQLNSKAFRSLLTNVSRLPKGSTTFAEDDVEIMDEDDYSVTRIGRTNAERTGGSSGPDYTSQLSTTSARDDRPNSKTRPSGQKVVGSSIRLRESKKISSDSPKDDEPALSVPSSGQQPKKLPAAVKGVPRSTHEPRTELRIKSRQRRGLLMVSEQKGRALLRKYSAGPSRQGIPNMGFVAASSQHQVVDKATETNEELGLKETSVSDVGRTSPTPSNISHVSMSDLENDATVSGDDQGKTSPNSISEPETVNAEEENDQDDESHKGEVARFDNSLLSSPPKRQLHSKRQRRAIVSDDEFEAQVSSHKAKGNNNSKRQRGKTRAAQPFLSDDKSEDALWNLDAGEGTSISAPRTATRRQQAQDATSSSGPRITKMARKSVKSREIIGFVAQDDDHPTTAFGSNFKPPLESTHTKTPGVLSADSPAESPSESIEDANGSEPEASNATTDKPISKQAPRLVNPATRGKKAARKEDAAGQVPQNIPQPAPVVPAPPQVEKQVTPTSNPVLQDKPVMPGFTTANGGAWSRHAEDLLGMTRPTHRSLRQR